MKTCPDCNGDGVVEKARTMNTNAQRVVAVVSYLMMMTTTKK
jgi:DnaJ-class molecular chaperone